MKKRLLGALMAACLVLGLMPAALAAGAVPFEDVQPTDWFYDSVVYVTQKGLMRGVSETSFQPEGVCDRAMFVTILHRMEHTPQVTGVSFQDVAEGTYYYDAVAWARASQIVKGYGDGRFGPQDPLSREQMMVILHRYADYKGYDVSARADLGAFSDADQVAPYAQEAMAWGVAAGVIQGTGAGTLDPAGPVTRAQAAAFLTRYGGLLPSGEETGARFALRDFTANQTALAAGTGATVTFTVCPSRTPSEDIVLYRDEGVALGILRDDGENGDAAANDGIYTFVWAIGDLPAGTYSCYALCAGAESRRIEISLAAGGVITGRVAKAEGRAALPGAVLNVYQDGLLCTTATADDGGAYSLYLPAGSYSIEITCPGYLPFQAYATVTGGSETYNETYLLVEGASGSMGSASGTVTSAITGRGLSGVLLSVRTGWNNTSVGDVLASAITDENGCYALDLSLGNYTLLATKEGCIPLVINIVSTAAGLTNQNGSITPIANGNVYRMVLTWGETPSDMDSHMVGPDAQGRTFHVNFGSGGVPGPEGTYICNLDVDDTNSYGPETITLDPQEGCTYYYYVQQYSEDGTMSGSGAMVRVYRGDTLLATFNVPTNRGNGAFWNVFAVKNGELVVKYTVTAKPDTSYAD